MGVYRKCIFVLARAFPNINSIRHESQSIIFCAYFALSFSRAAYLFVIVYSLCYYDYHCFVVVAASLGIKESYRFVSLTRCSFFMHALTNTNQTIHFVRSVKTMKVKHG